MHVQHILETCLYVDDLGQAERFYSDVLGLQFYSRVDGRHVFFRCGEGMFLLFRAQATQQPSGAIPTHGAIGPGHAAFAVTPEELNGWRTQLQDLNVAIEMEIEWPNGGQSIYFRDPAGNSVELATPAVWTMG